MTPATKLGLLLLACGTACAETGSNDDTDFTPWLTSADAGGTALPDASAALLPGAATASPVVATTDATTSSPGPFEAGMLNPLDAGRPPPIVAGPITTVDAAVDSGPTPASSVCSGPGTGAPGSTMDLTLNGRNYTLHIGRSVKPGTAAPLIFSLHGLTMTPASMELMARWDPIADTEGLIIARPAGVGSQNGWDLSGTKDFDLMKAIIEDVNSKACVDRKRIYATGFSHGGFMSFAIACKLGDIFAAVAPNAGSGSAARGCVARPVPVYAFHGDADERVSYSSGQTAVNSWVSHNMCTGTPSTFMVMNANCQDWSMCSAGGEVKFCTIPGLGHSYFRGATAAIWEFFKAHPLP